MSASKNAPLRVALNAYFLHHQSTGSGHYLNALLGSSFVQSRQTTIVPFVPDERGAAKQLSPADLPAFRARHLRPLSKLYFEQLALPRAIAGRADLVHYPYWAAPLRCSLPGVVTIHDLIPLLLPAYRGPLLARAYTFLVSCASRRAEMVIADSKASERDIVARLRIPAERVRVVPLAVDGRFNPRRDPGEEAAIRARYRLDAPFVFYVGGLDRRKNVDRLIAAFARALPALGGDHLLAIAGDSTRRGALFPNLPAMVPRGLERAVRFLGPVPDGDLPALYRAATVFAFPSLYEGFGLAPLEALACGTPVLCSNAASLPEVVGDAGVLVPPVDGEAWAGALARILGDLALRHRLATLGPAQAARFSWRTTMEETLAVYQEAVARRRLAKDALCAS